MIITKKKKKTHTHTKKNYTCYLEMLQNYPYIVLSKTYSTFATDIPRQFIMGGFAFLDFVSLHCISSESLCFIVPLFPVWTDLAL